MSTKDWAKMFERYAKLAGHTAVAGYVFDNLAERVAADGLTICDLKPLAELLGCEQRVSDIKLAVRELQVKADNSFALGYFGRTRDRKRLALDMTAIAQALNWECTEFDTLDELLEELRASEGTHSKFVDSAIQQNELMKTVREKLRALAELSAGRAQRPLIDELLDMLEQRTASGFAEGGYVADASEPEVCAQLLPGENWAVSAAAVLHGTEYYPGSTLLLQTAQLVAWRDADGQEHCERAHRVTLNPDRDGLAAAILSGIAGAQIAPEHIAELRAQMGGVL